MEHYFVGLSSIDYISAELQKWKMSVCLSSLTSIVLLYISNVKRNYIITSFVSNWQNHLSKKIISTIFHSSAPFKYKTDLNRTTGSGVFWIYGDSIGDFLYRSISKSPLCSEVFNDCRRTYNWIYNIPNGNIKAASAKNDDKDFDIDRWEQEVKTV